MFVLPSGCLRMTQNTVICDGLSFRMLLSNWCEETRAILFTSIKFQRLRSPKIEEDVQRMPYLLFYDVVSAHLQFCTQLTKLFVLYDYPHQWTYEFT